MKSNIENTDAALKALASIREKRIAGKHFEVSDTELKKRFFAAAELQDRLDHQRNIRLFRRLAVCGAAAIAALVAAAVIVFACSGIQQPESRDSDLYSEAELLFGEEAGVLCLDDEVLTFERCENKIDRNSYDVSCAADNGRRVRLRFSAAENEVIQIDNPSVRGSILVVPSDGGCDVMLIELNRNGKRVSEMIVVKS